jgi:hypothetical protein
MIGESVAVYGCEDGTGGILAINKSEREAWAPLLGSRGLAVLF